MNEIISNMRWPVTVDGNLYYLSGRYDGYVLRLDTIEPAGVSDSTISVNLRHIRLDTSSKPGDSD